MVPGSFSACPVTKAMTFVIRDAAFSMTVPIGSVWNMKQDEMR